MGGRGRLSEANFYNYSYINIQYYIKIDMDSDREMFRNASRHKRNPTLIILVCYYILEIEYFAQLV
jgi:hypothetical protein